MGAQTTATTFYAGAGAPPPLGPGEEVILTPLGGGADDGPQIQAALLAAAYHHPIRLAPGEWTVSTVINVPSGTTVRMGPGVRGTSTLPATPGGSPTSVPFLALPPLHTVLTTLTAPTVPGSRQVTLTSVAGFSVGGNIAFINGNLVCAYVIQAIAGNVVTLDEEMTDAFPVLGTSITDRDPPKDIRFYFDGAVWTGTGDALIEWSGAWRCEIRGLVVETPPGGPGFADVIVNFDVGCRENVFTDSHLDGGGFSASCWHFESGRHNRAERVVARGAVNQAVLLTSRRGDTLDGCAADASTVGCAVNAADGTNGSQAVGFDGCTFTANSGTGLDILNASARITVIGSDARYNGGTGFAVNGGAGASSRVSFAGCHSSENGGSGFYVVAGVSGVHFAGCTADGCAQYGFDGEGEWSATGISSTDCALGGVRVGAGGRASVVQAVLAASLDSSLAAWAGFTLASADTRALRIQDARVEMGGPGTKSSVSGQAAGVVYAEQLVSVGGTFGWVANPGAVLVEGPRVDLSSAATPYLGGAVYPVGGAMTARELGAGNHNAAPFDAIALDLSAGDIYLSVPAASSSPERGAWELELLCVAGAGTYAVAVTPDAGDIAGASGWSLALVAGEVRRFRAYPAADEWKLVTSGQGPAGASSALTPTSVRTSATSAAWGELVLCDPTAGGFTVTAPLVGPSDHGKSFGVKNDSGSVNPIPVQGSGGQTVDGGASVSITFARQSYFFVAVYQGGVGRLVVQ